MSDLNDMKRSGYCDQINFPMPLSEFGSNQRGRILNAILALAEESKDRGYVFFGESDFAKKFTVIRDFMFAEVYAKINHRWGMFALERAFEFIQNSQYFRDIDPIVPLALMTDTEIDLIAQDKYLNTPDLLKCCGILEIIEPLRNKSISCGDPDLKW